MWKGKIWTGRHKWWNLLKLAHVMKGEVIKMFLFRREDLYLTETYDVETAKAFAAFKGSHKHIFQTYYLK